MNWDPRILLDENTSSPAGGAAPPSPSPAGGGGGSAPPSSAPTEVSPDSSPAEGGSGTDPFDGMESNDYDAIDLGPVDTGTGDEPGAVPPAPVAVPPATPVTPATTAPAVPQTPVVAPPVPATPTGNVQAVPPQSQLEQTLEGLRTAANQTALADWASRELFKLSDEDVTSLDTNAADAIPKFMGRVYTQAMQSTVNLIKNLVPEMVNSGITTQQAGAQRANEALSEFYQSNPHLSADQHGAAVDRWARSFRAMNPQAPRAEAIAFVGKAVSAEFGLWPGQGAGNGAARRAAAPFAPARPGGRAPATQKGPQDPYAGMEEDFD